MRGAPRVVGAHLYVVAAPQLFVSIRHAGFISAVSACIKTLFSIGREGSRDAQQYGVYPNRSYTDVRAIGSGCNCCDSLQITVLLPPSSCPRSPAVSQAVSASPCPLPPPPLNYSHRGYSRLCCVRPSFVCGNGNTMLTLRGANSRMRVANAPPVERVTRHPIDPVRATAADSDIALCLPANVRPRACICG